MNRDILILAGVVNGPVKRAVVSNVETVIHPLMWAVTDAYGPDYIDVTVKGKTGVYMGLTGDSRRYVVSIGKDHAEVTDKFFEKMDDHQDVIKHPYHEKATIAWETWLSMPEE